MTLLRSWNTYSLGICAFVGLMLSAPMAISQEAGDGPPESGIVEPEPEGGRLGDLPNDQIRQFQMRRACEEDLPECLPEIRAIIDAERRNRNWMGIGIGSVLLLIFLLARREAEKKKQKDARELSHHRALGQRMKHRWRHEEEDPYKDNDPLGDE